MGALVVAAVLFMVLAVQVFVARHYANRALDQILAPTLGATLNANTNAIATWLSASRSEVETLGRWIDLRESLEKLQELARDEENAREKLLDSGELDNFQSVAAMTRSEPSDRGLLIVDRKGLILAALEDLAVGRQLSGLGMHVHTDAMEKGFRFLKPTRVADLIQGDSGISNQVIMAVVIRMLDTKDQPAASLWMPVDPTAELNDILRIAWLGKTGEAYAFDTNGLMLSESRYNPILQSIGILPAGADASSLLNVQLRDPGGDLANGYVPTIAPPIRPLTRPIQETLSGHFAGVALEGYRNYRGVEVVGGWRWLPEYGLGIIAEVEAPEARALLQPLQRVSNTALILLALTCLVILGYQFHIQRLQRHASLHQLGPYTLEKRIGQGGMGTVYLARHAMLRRPTAVKLIRESHASRETLTRFEREVQLTSQLAHPNTIEIYDFGRTDDGVFYYAMEYLDGISLARYVPLFGPMPPGRLIHVLRQATGSLAEAHAVGFIHRDVTPQNIMLCERGGVSDMVKVLDFGLIKDLGNYEKVSSTNAIPGTPVYIPPERLSDPSRVDARTDLYALGAVAFFMLTGREIYQGNTPIDIGDQILNAPVPRPSDHGADHLPPGLDDLVFSLLAKEPHDRPASALALLRKLEEIQTHAPWTQEEAHAWWEKHRETIRNLPPPESKDVEWKASSAKGVAIGVKEHRPQ